MADEDWKTIHLSWIMRNPKFVPKYAADYTEPYYEIMKQVYSNKNCSQDWARNSLASDISWKKKSDELITKMMKLKDCSSMHFITLGFNHQTWNVRDCVKLIETIIQYDWIETAKCVFELHRANGEHPHCHFLIKSSLTKSKILEKIWAAKNIKKLVLKKSFVDYKVGEKYHEDYVNGIKIDEKLPYVEKDIEWRKNNNIKQLFEK